jgi:hypothetical protein
MDCLSLFSFIWVGSAYSALTKSYKFLTQLTKISTTTLCQRTEKSCKKYSASPMGDAWSDYLRDKVAAPIEDFLELPGNSMAS